MTPHPGFRGGRESSSGCHPSQRSRVVCLVNYERSTSPGLVSHKRFVEGLRVLVVGGISSGVILIGVGSRLAMLLLRVTSPDRVRGVKSDDGFIIGQVTLAGTYNLLVLGAVVGIIGAAAYLMVAPWLIGPKWFRRLTTGLAAAAVVGSMLVHPDGIDFTVLKPMWLAIGVFIALPGLFGVLVGVVVDAVGRPESWTARGRWRVALPIFLVACFPLSIFVVIIRWSGLRCLGPGPRPQHDPQCATVRHVRPRDPRRRVARRRDRRTGCDRQRHAGDSRRGTPLRDPSPTSRVRGASGPDVSPWAREYAWECRNRARAGPLGVGIRLTTPKSCPVGLLGRETRIVGSKIAPGENSGQDRGVIGDAMRKTGWFGAMRRSSLSGDFALTPSKKMPTSAFHRRR